MTKVIFNDSITVVKKPFILEKVLQLLKYIKYFSKK
jgi:hypothetical protein